MQTANEQIIGQLRQTLLTRWPEAARQIPVSAVPRENKLESGLESLLSITFGQIVELTGSESSGKTSLAHFMLPAHPCEPAYWLSLSVGSFAVPTSGTVHYTVSSLKEAITAGMTIIGAAAFQRVVLDLSNVRHCRDHQQDFTPRWYQFRRIVVRQYAQLLVLTSEDCPLLPNSVVTRKIAVSRGLDKGIRAHVVKSRVGGEGVCHDIATTV